MHRILTLMISINAIADSPKTISPFLLSPKWMYNFSTISLTESPLNRTPKIPLSCDITIIMEVAVVKPDVTGVDIKSTINPVKDLQRCIFGATMNSRTIISMIKYNAWNTIRESIVTVITRHFSVDVILTFILVLSVIFLFDFF